MESKSTTPDPPAAERPRELPFDHADLEALGGHIGPDPEDFVVDEVPLYAASGQGDHWYVRFRKREATTLDLRKAVAEAAGVAAGDIGYAGMKDKHAVTTQWLSVPTVRARPPEAWQLPSAFQLLEVLRHNNKLRVGHLRGNRFAIRLVSVHEQAAERLGPLFERLSTRGLTNYFGAQRFGSGQQNLQGALYALRRGRLGPRAGTRGKFLASVIQSEVFNRYAIERVARGADRVLAGEVVRLGDGRALFTVEDAAREQSRLERGELRLTGPMIGPKMKESAGEPRQIEQAALAGLGLDDAALGALGRWAPGTRRDLLLWPTELASAPAAGGGLTVSFTLPAGAYASLVIRTLTRGHPWQGAAADAEGTGDADVGYADGSGGSTEEPP